MKMTTKLRKSLEEEVVIRVGVTDPLMAKLAESIGINCLAVTGSLTGQTQCYLEPLSTPDLYTRVAAPIIANVNTPVFAEGCAGFGDAAHAAFAVKLYIKAGLAGMFIEDAVHPKRMGYWGRFTPKGGQEKYVISAEEMVTKIKAAVKMRDSLDPDFVLDVRTDSFGCVNGSLEEAIRRCNMYAEAGADGVMPMLGAAATEEMLKTIRAQVPKPIKLRGAGPGLGLSIDDYQRLGFTMCAWPNALGTVLVKAARDLFKELVDTTRKSYSYQADSVEIGNVIAKLTDVMLYWQIEQDQEKAIGLPCTINHLQKK